MDAGHKRGYDDDTDARLQVAQLGDGGGYHVKQSVNRWSRTDRWSRIEWSRIEWSRIALAAVLTGALGLVACGRKGPLDPPPTAGLTQNTANTPQIFPSLGQDHYGVPPGAGIAPPPPAAAAPAPAAPPPQQKSFFLDFLIGK